MPAPNLPNNAHADTVAVEIPAAVVRAFRGDARARDISVQRLIRELLTTVANDHLVNAVLGTEDFKKGT